MNSKNDIKILAIETASEACSAALLIVGEDNNQRTFEQIELKPRQHAKLILSLLDTVLEEGNTSLKDVDVIAFGQGPGAFTGLRIAAGVAQGISLSVDKRVVPVSTLAALALQTVKELEKQEIKYENEIIATALDARMGEVYWGLFILNGSKIEALGEEQVSKPEIMLESLLKTVADMKSCHILAVGEGWGAYQEEIFHDNNIENITHLKMLSPTASSIATLALPLYRDNKTVAPEDAQPVYIRNDVAKKSQKK